MIKAWNKGKTKETNAAVRQISETMKSRGVDNFAAWRKGQLKQVPKSIPQDGDLAELIGAVLGDGYIGQHERTQVLRIVSNSDNPGFVRRYSALVERSFKKAPRVSRRKQSNTIDIVIYQKAIAERLGLETGAKHIEYSNFQTGLNDLKRTNSVSCVACTKPMDVTRITALHTPIN